MGRMLFRRRLRRNLFQSRLACQQLEHRLAPATFTVTTLTDNVPGSLRAAISSANGLAGDDSINFQAGLFGVVTLTAGQLLITDGVTITGPAITVNGNGLSRVFNTVSAPTGEKITLVALNIVNGKVAGPGGGLLAGDESVTLLGCVVSGNSITGAANFGGGIAVLAGSLTVSGGAITNNNSVDADGGGILVTSGTGTITSCAITGNTAKDGGGAIFAHDSTLTITNSTLSGNSSATEGGGIFFDGTVGAGGFTVRNSTLSGNTATGTGGGVALNFFGTLVVENSTITSNTAGGSGGGGIGRFAGTGSISLESSVVSGNTHTAGANEDLFTTGTVTAKYSAVFTTTGVTTFTPDNPSKYLVAVDYKLGTLSSNGGSTQTHVPAADSPLINKGSNPAALTTDQRGGVATRNSNGGVDIGSVELQSFLVINTSNTGTGSLRQAVSNANSLGGFDTVAFDPSIFAFTTTITLTTTELAINDGVTIIGPAAKLTINGNGINRIFNTSGAAAKATVTVSGLTLTGCTTTLSGGAIFVDDEALTLTNCVITGNTSGAGGGIYVNGTAGSLTLQACTVTNNATSGSDAEGGGIFMYSGSATIRDTTISGNTSSGAGAGIAFYNGGSLLMESSTVSGNRTTNDQGGGLYFFGAPAVGGVIVRNSTFSGNTASSTGGGIGLSNFTGNFTVQNCTITNNTASGANGGGIARSSGTGTMTLSSTIVAGNLNANTPDLFFNAATNVNGSNLLVGVADAGNFTLTGSGKLTGTKASPLNAKLGTLQDNGGPTLTHFLLFDSPAIDKGNNGVVTTDQRGTGFPRVSGPAADIGAVERGATIVLNTSDSGVGSLRQAVLNGNANPGTDTITFDSSVFDSPQTITLTTGVLTITDSTTISGPGTGLLSISGNNASRVISYNDSANKLALTLADLSIVNAKSASGNGGGLSLRGGTITLNRVNISSCSATAGGGGGGGASISGASPVMTKVTMIECNFTGNQAAGFGGGLHTAGFVDITIQRCTISGNTAAGGGGLYLYAGNSSLLVEGTTISGNTDGGVRITGPSATGIVTLRNCTISGNSSSSGIGGVSLIAFNGTLALLNSTVTANSGLGTSSNHAGGIGRTSGSAVITIESSIVSGNSHPVAPDISSTGTVNVNFSAVGSAAGFTLTGANNLPFGTDLKLGLLANNGGPTLTHLPALNSPVRDKGSNVASLALDQRGTGFQRVWNAAADIGALELPPLLIVGNVNNSGPDSLRQVVFDATAISGPDTITFDPVFFGSAKTITLTTGEIPITGNDNLTISGPAANVTIDGNAAGRIFNITTGFTSVVLEGLALTNGKVSGTLSGGAILLNSSFANLTLQDCSITNSIASSGGAISAIGPVIIRRSTLAANSAKTGGAISVDVGLFGGALTIEDSTLSGNTSTAGSGGAIFFDVDNSPLSITNSTLSGNSASGSGGAVGLVLVNSSSVAVFKNSTITANSAGANGGGIARLNGIGAVSLSSTIVSGNVNANTPDLSFTSATNVSGNNNLVGVIDAGNFTLTGTGNLVGIKSSPLNAKLGALTNNGGPTLTHALLVGSLAINAGNNVAGLANDQRGAGFARNVNGSADIGAFELQAAPPRVLDGIINGGQAQRSRVTQVKFIFNTIVTLPTNPETAFQLKRNSDNASIGLVALVTNGTTTDVNLTFTGPLVESGSLPDGRYTLTIFASQVTANGLQLDGNGDGVGGDNHVVPSSGTGGIFRLFGDADGDANVAANDFIQFRLALGGNNSIFDFDNDGAVAAGDFIQFRLRFGGSM